MPQVFNLWLTMRPVFNWRKYKLLGGAFKNCLTYLTASLKLAVIIIYTSITSQPT